MKWLEANLEQVLSLDYGWALPKRRRNRSGSIPVVGSKGIVGTHTECIVTAPGIVVGRTGAAGKISWIEQDFWPLDSSFYVRRLVPVEMRWLFYLLHFLKLDHLAMGRRLPVLKRNDAYKLKISLPAPSEQRKIVEILDRADGLRKKGAEADAKSERILPALLIKTFGDPATKRMGNKRLDDLMMAKIDTQALRSLSTLIPDLEQQRTFRETIARLELTVRRADANAKLETLFDLLLQRAFSGELTAKWRKEHQEQLQTEIEELAKILGARGTHLTRKT